MESPDSIGYEVQYWKTPDQIRDIDYAAYWNDESRETSKEWWILDNNWEKMERYIEDSGLKYELSRALESAEDLICTPLQGTGADLASGTLWTIPLLLDGRGAVERVYAVEYSQHRLLKLGPAVLKHYRVPSEKVTLCLGSFYELHMADQSLDFLVLSQAFHHAENPPALLKEIHRVLKPNGVVIITGEHILPGLTVKGRIRHAFKFLVSKTTPRFAQNWLWGHPIEADKLFLSEDPVPPDPVLGDHFYYDTEYNKMFTSCGFAVKQLKYPEFGKQSFLLRLVG
jgi:SAM-dependent methyltransferase